MALCCQSFDPQVVIGVDWTSVSAYQALLSSSALQATAVFMYMNFRIATHSTGVSDDDKAFYKRQEADASSLSTMRVALCNTDAQILQDYFPHPRTSVLWPPLREEVRVRALDTASHPRVYITCCARISVEKNVERFVDLMSANKELLAEMGLTPYLVGASVPGDYSEQVVGKLKKAFPGDSSIVRDFMCVTWNLS